MILSDCHMHTRYSGDSEADMEQMVLQAIRLGLPRICFTDHYDMDMVYDGIAFDLDTDPYQEEIFALQRKYAEQIAIGFGVELGMAPYLKERIETYVNQYDFDFVIGSVHAVDGIDPYEREKFDMSDEEMYKLYFECVLQNVQQINGIHTLGHLDYVVRYGYEKEKNYSYKKYAEVIDAILETIIRRDIALEVNAAGLKYGLPFTNPHEDIVKRYLEMGGEMITIGSDAHCPEHIGYDFSKVQQMLERLGVHEITEFIGGKPVLRG